MILLAYKKAVDFILVQRIEAVDFCISTLYLAELIYVQ
jgi:hypothetical protein